MSQIGLLPDCRRASGGPASFQRKFATGLSGRGLHACYDVKDAELDAMLLINATRHLSHVWRAKRHGVPVVQRLGAPFPSNTHRRVGLGKRMRIWLAMQNVAYVRSHVADRIVYQSHFVRECWNRIRGEVNKPDKIIYNGVDLAQFSPEGPKYVSGAEFCIVSVEGTQRDPEGHPALLLAQCLITRGVDVELLVFGKPAEDGGRSWENYPFVRFGGLVSNAELPFFYRGAGLYILTDIVNAGCPNSMIEALACGTPVIGYDLGVLPEMLDASAGRCVPPHGDPWKGEDPGNTEGLSDAALEIFENNGSFRAGARRLAESRYGLDHMMDEYMDFLLQ